jgi:hypothetical protein
LTDKILNLLDARSLANAELVCRQWRSYIADGRCWKKYLQSKKVKPKVYSIKSQLIPFNSYLSGH